MKKTNGFAFLEKVRRNSAAFLASLLLIPTFCLLFAWQVRAEDGKANGQKQAHADYARLAGTWLRLDGGYVLEFKDIGSKGRLKARYFNPKQINVAKAEWRQRNGSLQVFVELRDVNYPGSTYTLVYSPEKDSLEGNYFQALQGQTYAIGFIRIK
jgi:hypothetical protein